MPRGFYKELIDILERRGCYFHRQAKGDHEYWCNPENGKCTAIDKITKSKILANRCLKQLGLDDKI